MSEAWGTVPTRMALVTAREREDDMLHTIRLYEHPDAPAKVEHKPGLEVEAHGWDYAVGEIINVSGVPGRVVKVYDNIHTGDVRGNYILAEVEEGLPPSLPVCEWGECEEPATVDVDYPARVPGFPSDTRCSKRGVETMHVCAACAEVAKAEAAEAYAMHGDECEHCAPCDEEG